MEHLSFDVLLALSEKGDNDARFYLALRYLNGQGCPADDVKAREWLTLAAQDGDAASQYNLSILCKTGRGGSADEAAYFA